MIIVIVVVIIIIIIIIIICDSVKSSSLQTYMYIYQEDAMGGTAIVTGEV